MSTIFNEKVSITDTQLADNNDKVVAIGSNGEIKETGKTVGDLGSVQDLDSVLTEGNTTNKDINSTGDITTVQSTAKVVNVSSSDTTPVINFINNITSKSARLVQGAQLNPLVNLILPSSDGVLALTNQLTTEWATYSGTRSGEDLNVTLGDYSDSGLGTKINIDDENEMINITSLSGIEINGKLIAFRDTGVVSIIKTIDTSTPQTSATLNASFPFADNPEGTSVVNLDATERYTYKRISSTLWRRGELMTDI